jgi:hypothetical protein
MYFMKSDLFVRVMLVMIVGLLACNLFMQGPRRVEAQTPAYRLIKLNGPVTDWPPQLNSMTGLLKEIVTSDNRTYYALMGNR